MPVIYKMNPNEPNNPEVAILGGAGVLSFNHLKARAVERLKSLTQSLENSPAEMDWRGALYRTEHNLLNDLRTIKAVYEELEAIRRAGGHRSRGIARP